MYGFIYKLLSDLLGSLMILLVDRRYPYPLRFLIFALTHHRLVGVQQLHFLHLLVLSVFLDFRTNPDQLGNLFYARIRL